MDISRKSRIAILPEEVVNKIAAGEVVVRPVNAVKELIENCLDAGATEITVTIQNGGLDLISVKDNGSGIHKEDMPMVCARHATSKLVNFEDLQKMATYGFRGEAMASISYVSRVSIISRTADDNYAHKANFLNGSMIEGSLSNSAGLIGTSINAEELFYNCPSRRQSLKYPQEESNRIADLLVKYSIHNPHVSFAYRRLDSHSCDFRTDGKGDMHSTILALLHHLRSKSKTDKDLTDFEFRDDRFHFCFNVCMATPITTFTSTAVQSRKNRQKIFHLFINDRLVDCESMKKSIDLVFSSKDLMCPFMTISLHIHPKYVDVNVHPTKSSVHFMNENKIIDRIEQEIFQLVTEYKEKGVIEVGRAAVRNDDVINNQRVGFSVPSAATRPVIQQPSSQDWLMQPQTWDLSNPRRKNFAIRSKPGSKSTTPWNADSKEENSYFDLTHFQKNAALNQKFSSPVHHSINTNKSHISVDGTYPATPSNSCQKIRIEANNRSLDEFVSPCRFSFTDVPTDSLSQTTLSSPAVLGPVKLVPISLPGNLEGSEARTFQDIDQEDLLDIKEEGPCDLSQCDHVKIQTLTSRNFELDKLDELRKSICNRADHELVNLFRQHSFIGFFSQNFGVFQSNEAAYVFHISTLLKELFYQLVIFSFGNMGSYRLCPSIQSEQGCTENFYSEECDNRMVSVRELLGLHFDDMDAVQINKMVDILLSNVEMLWDYFSIEIVASETHESQLLVTPVAGPFLKSLPCVLDGYSPPLENLPEFIYELANVDSTDEQKCYEGVATALANLYTPVVFSSSICQDEENSDYQEQYKLRLEFIRRLVFPAFKSSFLPPSRLRTSIHQIASIEEAFKKFGRC